MISFLKKGFQSNFKMNQAKWIITLIAVLTGALLYIFVAVIEQKFDNIKKPEKVTIITKWIETPVNITSEINVTQRSGRKSPYSREHLQTLTVITAYWDLGTFKKGLTGKQFSKSTYFSWASTFKYLVNQLVVYTDSVEFKELMEKLRDDQQNSTMIFLINRTELWPFKLTNKIAAIYNQSGYPKYYPNTVNPNYTAAQHAKYAVVANTVRNQIFRAPYYAWLDVGYFRDIADKKVFFKLNIPSGFDSDRLAVNRVYDLPMNMDPFNIFRNNAVWVGGGLFLGSGKVILEFEKQYQKAVLYFIDQNLMNSDQQVLYSLYCEKGRKALDPKVNLQLYIPKGSGNPWFYLGYLCLKTV